MRADINKHYGAVSYKLENYSDLIINAESHVILKFSAKFVSFLGMGDIDLLLIIQVSL